MQSDNQNRSCGSGNHCGSHVVWSTGLTGNSPGAATLEIKGRVAVGLCVCLCVFNQVISLKKTLCFCHLSKGPPTILNGYTKDSTIWQAHKLLAEAWWRE